MIDSSRPHTHRGNEIAESNANSRQAEFAGISEVRPGFLRIGPRHGATILSIKENLSVVHFASFLQVVSHLLSCGYSENTVLNSFVRSLNVFFRETQGGLTVSSMSRCWELCRVGVIHSIHFRNLRTLLKQWHALNLPGVEDELIDFIRPIVVQRLDRPAGSRVRSNDPEEGWYTDSEYDSLVSRVWSSYENGEKKLSTTVALLLSTQYGRRPVQIAGLKVCDLKWAGESGGISGKRIEFPGAKDVRKAG
jgi:hypothetical protein